MCGSLTGRYRSKQIYEQEMKLGHILLDLDKILMFGIAGSGKTSTLAVLLGLAPPDIRCSTPLMKRPITVMFMCVNEKMEWEEKTQEQMREIVAKVISSRVPKQHTVAQSDASPASPDQQPSHTTTSQSRQPTAEKSTPSSEKKTTDQVQSEEGVSLDSILKSSEVDEGFVSPSNSGRSSPFEAAGKSTPSSEKKTTDQVQSEEGVSLDSLLKSTEVDEGFVSSINSGRTFLEAIVRLRQLLIADSGGQPEFLETMPVFLNGASKFVYVMKAHESLEKRTMVQYFKDNKLVWEFPASHTNEDTLKQCTRTMRSLNAKNPKIPPSKMLFLATHRDMVPDKELPGVLKHLHKRLKKILLPEFKEQLIFCDQEGEDFIFTLNAAKPEDKDRECGQAIRECLSKSEEGREPVKVPLRWYTLYQKLLEIMNGLGKKVLSREQCRQVAESMEMDDGSCEEALNFFNGLNLLFYFPTILPNLVFIEPQMLLDKVSELVDETYHMRQGDRLQPMVGERLKFRDYGQVTEKFLSEFKSHYEPPLFTPKELITLLRGLLVLADLSEGVYFMPCLLRVESSEVVTKYRMSNEKALALHFPDGGPLLGMFCCTVAYLLSPENTHPCPWKVVENEAGIPECLHRNVIQFTIPKKAGTISLIDHFTHFEIHIHSLPKKADELWKLVHDGVFAGLKKARKTIGYTSNTPIPAIVCPAHPATPHPATVDGSVWTCSQMSKKFGDIPEDDPIPWLSVCDTHSEY